MCLVSFVPSSIAPSYSTGGTKGEPFCTYPFYPCFPIPTVFLDYAIVGFPNSVHKSLSHLDYDPKRQGSFVKRHSRDLREFLEHGRCVSGPVFLATDPEGTSVMISSHWKKAKRCTFSTWTLLSNITTLSRHKKCGNPIHHNFPSFRCWL